MLVTSDEIKATYSMRDILARYGLEPNRVGFIQCPFHHGDREASMKIYKRDFHCFGCGANGDIFDFVQRMDDLSFREAFESLGGSYERSFSADLKVYRAKKRRETERKKAEKLRQKKQLNNDLIDIYRTWMERSEPLSDAWCDCCNALQRELYRHSQLNNMDEMG